MTGQSLYTLIAGAGPGTGRAIALRFAKTYPVVLLARHAKSYQSTIEDVEKAGGQAIGIEADISDASSIGNVFSTIEKTLPGSQLAAAIYNLNTGFLIKPFLNLKPEEFRTGVGGVADSFFSFAQGTLPSLLRAVPNSPYPPSLIVSGATASLKASAQFSSFSAGKFALRAMSQSLAREFGPQGVHVAHAIIDGLIDTPATRAWGNSEPEPDSRIQPEAIAESYWHLHTQPRSAFTHEIDIRPFSEKF